MFRKKAKQVKAYKKCGHKRTFIQFGMKVTIHCTKDKNKPHTHD